MRGPSAAADPVETMALRGFFVDRRNIIGIVK